MDAEDVQKIVCRRCFALLDVSDNFCRHCGAAAAGDAGPVVASVKVAATRKSKGADNPWVVLMMLFVVLGPLALPMLWRSRGFSPLWKTLLTLVMVGVTALLLFLMWFVIAKALVPLQQLKTLRGF
jgi:hypothetical protein